MSAIHKKRFVDKFSEPTSLNELGHLLVRHLNDHKKWNTNSTTNNDKVAGLYWELDSRKIGAAPTFLRKVGASHYAPIGKSTNFWNADRYPAWAGRLWLRMKSQGDFWISDLFDDSCTYIGTGGGGDYNSPWTAVYEKWHAIYKQNNYKKKPDYPEPHLYSWSYTIWQEDWPLIQKNFEENFVFHKLAGESTKSVKHIFHWQDPKLHKLDSEWLKNG